jgi:folate-binding protein YgfZ
MKSPTASLEVQLEAAKSAALVIDAPELATIDVTGGDRQSWLNGLLTCDLAPLRAGQGAYGLAVTQKGRILADVVIMLDEDRVHVAVPLTVEADVRASFERYLIMEDAEMLPDDAPFAVALVHGPRSADVLDAARAAGARGALLDRSGLGGAVLFVPPDQASAVAGVVDATLASLGGARGDTAGWDAIRIARAIPRFGVDFDASTYPQEAGLEKTAVSFSKGCYLGQEVVCMIEMRGHVKRRLVPVRLADGADVAHASLPAAGTDVADAGGQKVGEVTSAARGPDGAAMALAMVKRASAESGTRLRVGDRDATVLAPEA